MKPTRPRDLIRLIAERRRAEALAPLIARQEALARALDAVNALDALDARRRAFPRGTCFGPRPYFGALPVVWVGALIWRRGAAGYYGYKTLVLYGVWARDAGISGQEPPRIEIAAAARTIAYTSDFYTAEAYFRLIRDGFEDYYADDGRPPGDAPAVFVYDPAERLAQRAALNAALNAIVR